MLLLAKLRLPLDATLILPLDDASFPKIAKPSSAFACGMWLNVAIITERKQAPTTLHKYFILNSSTLKFILRVSPPISTIAAYEHSSTINPNNNHTKWGLAPPFFYSQGKYCGSLWLRE